MMEKTKKALTKEKIQQAAFKCVARFGFGKTNLDDIAREVGLNKATLYYYYKNKEDIFLDITTTATRQFLTNLVESTTAVNGNLVQKTRHFLVERSMYYVRMVAQVHISEAELRQVEHLFYDQIQDVYVQEHRFLSDLFKKSIEKGEMKPIAADQLATNLISLSEGIKHTAKLAFSDAQSVDKLGNYIAENIDFMLNLIFDKLLDK